MKIPFSCFLGALAFLLIGLAIGDYVEMHQKISYIESQSKANSAVENKRTRDPERPAGAHRDPISGGNAEQGQQEPPETFVIPGLRKSMKISDALLILLTAALACFTLGLLREESTKTPRELRAYILFENAGVSNIQIGKVPEAEVHFKNFGRTPAYDTYVTFGIAFIKDVSELADLINIHWVKYRVGPSHIGADGLLRPQSRYGGMEGAAINQGLWDELKAGKRFLYVAGRVDYTDVFKKPHWATFRLWQDGKAALIGSNELILSHAGNDADRD